MCHQCIILVNLLLHVFGQPMVYCPFSTANITPRIFLGSPCPLSTDRMGTATLSPTVQSEMTPPLPETTQPLPETTQPLPETTQPLPETTQPLPSNSTSIG
jgi:hypothetical protein